MTRASALFLTLTLLVLTASPVAATDKPNILVIWGDDIGYRNVSAYNQGMRFGTTLSVDGLVKQLGAPGARQ